MNGPRPLQRVAGAQRIVEKLAAVVDARQARHGDELVAEDLVPERLHRLDLGEEAVAADVEPEPLVPGGLRDAADDVRAFEDGGPHALLRQQIGRGQAGGTGADDDDVLARQKGRHGSGRHQKLLPQPARHRRDIQSTGSVEADIMLGATGPTPRRAEQSPSHQFRVLVPRKARPGEKIGLGHSRRQQWPRTKVRYLEDYHLNDPLKERFRLRHYG